MDGKIIKVSTLAIFMMLSTIISAHAGYKGKVVNADTSKPIEGAVVLMYWNLTNRINGYEKFFNAEETLTDVDGRFEIKDRKANLNPLLRKDEPIFDIFKRGYKDIHLAWVISVFKEDLLKHKVGFEGDLPIFKLKKIGDLKERRKSIPSRGTFEDKHQRLFIQEINKERILFNLSPVGEVDDESE